MVYQNKLQGLNFIPSKDEQWDVDSRSKDLNAPPLLNDLPSLSWTLKDHTQAINLTQKG